MILHQKILQLRKQQSGGFAHSTYDGGLDFRVKAKGRDVSGYLAVFGKRDSYGTVPVRGCFAKSIKERGPESKAKNKIIFLAYHNPFDPIGQFTELVEDDYGLRFTATISDTPGQPQRCLDQINDGTINQFSYGFRYVWDQMKYDEEFQNDDGTKGAILKYECALFEGSCVAILASQPETFAIRTDEDFAQRMELLNMEAEDIVTTLPLSRQIEVRQLITRYKSLADYRSPKKELEDHVDSTAIMIGGYKLDSKQFK